MKTPLIPIRLLDNNFHVIATGSVEEDNGVFVGSIDLSGMPAALRRLFEEYESLVNDQVLSALDSLEDRIAAMKLSAHFADNRIISLTDLQIFPREQAISFVLGSECGSIGAIKEPSASDQGSLPGRVA